MSNRIEYTKGQILGDYGIQFVCDEKPTFISGHKQRMGCFICGYCGKEFVTRIGRVKNNEIKSCGCHGSIKQSNFEETRQNLLGKKFGKLTVVGIYENTCNYVRKCRCQCECGNIIDVRCGTSGNSKSCGCLQKKDPFHQGQNLTGKVFGKLTVLEFLGTKGASRW